MNLRNILANLSRKDLRRNFWTLRREFWRWHVYLWGRIGGRGRGNAQQPRNNFYNFNEIVFQGYCHITAHSFNREHMIVGQNFDWWFETPCQISTQTRIHPLIKLCATWTESCPKNHEEINPMRSLRNPSQLLWYLIFQVEYSKISPAKWQYFVHPPFAVITVAHRLSIDTMGIHVAHRAETYSAWGPRAYERSGKENPVPWQEVANGR